jgi:hypothetical protein
MKLMRVFTILLIVLAFASCGQGQKFVEHTVDVDTAFSNYEWFHSTYQDIMATATKIKTAYDMTQVKDISQETKENYLTNYTGAINYMQSEIGDYNAKSKMWNRSLFKDKKLPYQIEATITGGDVKISDPSER